MPALSQCLSDFSYVMADSLDAGMEPGVASRDGCHCKKKILLFYM